MASVDSGHRTRDDHLRSPDLFDVARHPAATFRSTAVAWHGTAGRVTGDLTIAGVTRPLTLAVDYLVHARDPWGHDRAVFSAWAAVNREDWGLTWKETGGLLVSKDIRIEIELETIRQA